MKGKRNKRGNVSNKNKNKNGKEAVVNENPSPEVEEDGDVNSEKNESEEPVQKKTVKKDQRWSSWKVAKKAAAETSEEEENEGIQSNEPNLSKHKSKRKTMPTRTKKSLLGEDEINGEKIKAKKNPRRSNRKVEKISLSEIIDYEDDDDEEEFEKPLKSINKGSKRKTNSKGSEMKKLKVDDKEKNGESDAGQKDTENLSKTKKADNKKQKKNAKSDDENDDEEAPSEEYEVERLVDIYFKKNGEREFLVRWKGYSSKDDTWEPERHLNCKELIDAFLKKCEKAKNIPVREMRRDRRLTDRYNVNPGFRGRKLSARFKHKPRKTYFDIE